MEGTVLQVTQKYQLVDESFSQGMVDRAILLAILDEERFSYCILDSARQKVVVLKDYRIVPKTKEGLATHFMEQVLEQDETLQSLNADKIIFSVHTNCSAIVPSPLFSKGQAKDILSLTCQLQNDSRVYDDLIKLADAHHIYAVPENFLKETGTHFKELNLFNANTAFIESQLMLNKHHEEAIVAVNVRSGSFDVVITQGSELLFSNIFNYETSEDFIYYLLFTLEQLELNPDITAVRFYGDIDKLSSAWMVSKKYIRNVSFGEWPEGIEFSYGFQRIAAHQYFVLFSQHLCVS
jgi:hypothetical protein